LKNYYLTGAANWDNQITDLAERGQDYSQAAQQRELYMQSAQAAQMHMDVQQGVAQGLHYDTAYALAQPHVNQQISTLVQNNLVHYNLRLGEIYQASQQGMRATSLLMEQFYPELRGAGANPQAFAAILEGLRRGNPQRYAQIRQGLNIFTAQLQQSLAVSDQYIAAQKTLFNSYANQEDARFRNAHPELRTERGLTKAARMTLDYLRNGLGMTDHDIKANWENNATFRSAGSQAALWMAAKHWNNQKGVEQKLAKARAPRVQTPGVAGAVSARPARSVPESFSGGRRGLQEAAAIYKSRAAHLRNT
jgi:hypothetical protein